MPGQAIKNPKNALADNRQKLSQAAKALGNVSSIKSRCHELSIAKSMAWKIPNNPRDDGEIDLTFVPAGPGR